ncbi:MAG: hypothetical protein AAF193_03360, partial [Bacteroidota bacterium]
MKHPFFILAVMNFVIQKANLSHLQGILEINNHVIETTAANYDVQPHGLDYYKQWWEEKSRNHYPVIV